MNLGRLSKIADGYVRRRALPNFRDRVRNFLFGKEVLQIPDFGGGRLHRPLNPSGADESIFSMFVAMPLYKLETVHFLISCPFLLSCYKLHFITFLVDLSKNHFP